MSSRLLTFFLIALIAASCRRESGGSTGDSGDYPVGTFGYDLALLKQMHHDAVLLDDGKGAQVVIVPAYQGRVMTSTASPAQSDKLLKAIFGISAQQLDRLN